MWNTPASNITRKSSSKNLNYSNIIKYYLDEDTIPGRMCLKDEQWANTGMCTDVEFKRVVCAANARALKEQQKLKDEEIRLMWSQGISRPLPGSERSVQVKIVRKIHLAKREKKIFDGL